VFRIRKEQFEALGRIAYERFVHDAVAHVRPLAPFAASHEEQLEPWVRPRIERALALGLTEEIVVLRFLETAARFDDAFAERADVLAVLANVERAIGWDDTMRTLRVLHAMLRTGAAPNEVERSDTP
jgi:hypothetical protein